MAKIERDTIHGAPAALEGDEKIIATFAPDAGAYWKSHAVMAVVSGLAAGVVLVVLGNPSPWVGPLAAVLAVAVRALYLKSEALAEDWRMTNRRLLGPGGRIVPLSQIAQARSLLGAAQVITKGGDKHLIKYQSDAAATAAAVLKARDGGRG